MFSFRFRDRLINLGEIVFAFYHSQENALARTFHCQKFSQTQYLKSPNTLSTINILNGLNLSTNTSKKFLWRCTLSRRPCRHLAFSQMMVKFKYFRNYSFIMQTKIRFWFSDLNYIFYFKTHFQVFQISALFCTSNNSLKFASSSNDEEGVSI